MSPLLEKLNYKGQRRIALIDPGKSFDPSSVKDLKDVQTDADIDQRFPYDFMIIFVNNASEVDEKVPRVLHNLVSDGTLWFCYPKKGSAGYSPDLDRNHGWKVLNDAGFYSVKLVSVNDDWSALRFRSKKYIKSSSVKLQS